MVGKRKRKEWEVMGGNMTGRMGKGMIVEERGKWRKRGKRKGVEVWEEL